MSDYAFIAIAVYILSFVTIVLVWRKPVLKKIKQYPDTVRMIAFASGAIAIGVVLLIKYALV